MDTEEVQKPRPRSGKTTLLPEVDVYLHLLLLVYLIDQKKYPQVWSVQIDLLLRLKLVPHAICNILFCSWNYLLLKVALELKNCIKTLQEYFLCRYSCDLLTGRKERYGCNIQKSVEMDLYFILGCEMLRFTHGQGDILQPQDARYAGAKCYYYYARAYELTDQLEKIRT